MHSAFPFSDPVLWLRWLAAAAAIVWLPGHLAAGRWLGRLEPLGRAVLSLAAGLLLVPLVGLLFDVTRIPLTPLGYLAFALPAAWALGRWRAHREAVAGWTAGIEPLGTGWQIALVATAAIMFALLQTAYGRFCAPPHVHDASNHAYLVRRIAELATTNLGKLFALDAGVPAQRYLPGWHAAAALCARLGGIAPYVSAWFLPLAAACLLPAAAAILWRAWRMPVVACVLGALLATANQNVPGGVLSWGGLGLVVGFAVAPLVAIALLPVIRGGTAWQAGLAGILAGMLAQVHGSAVATAVVLALAAPGLTRAEREAGSAAALPKRWLAPLIAIALFGALTIPSLLALEPGFYTGVARAVDAAGSRQVRLGYAIEQVVNANHSAPFLRGLLLIGLYVALITKRARRPALVALLLGGLYVALAAGRAPWLRRLAVVFYGESNRVLYLQYFFLPLFAALLLRSAGRRLAARVPMRARMPLLASLAAAALLAAMALGYPQDVRNMRAQSVAVPFTRAEYDLAGRIAGAVAPDSLIANFWDDGSTWTMQVCGRRFLEPLSWRVIDPAGGQVRDDVAALAQMPWPASARALRRLGVTHLYVCDRRWQWADPCPARAAFDADPRFARVLTGGQATLYRVLWDRELSP